MISENTCKLLFQLSIFTVALIKNLPESIKSSKCLESFGERILRSSFLVLYRVGKIGISVNKLEIVARLIRFHENCG